MALKKIKVATQNENFYKITPLIKQAVKEMVTPSFSGIVLVYNPHTSCGLLISESFDSSAAEDMKNFLKHIAPTTLPFIQHTSEGVDDSPSHMKNLLLSPTLTLIIEKGELLLGQWQGVFLCEFRQGSHNRNIYIKTIEG